jgi:hypothetical protein
MVPGRLAVVVIALIAEVCATAGPSLLTLCIHEDGSVRYEPTLALCCKQNEQGQGECCSHETGSPFEGGELTPEDTCSDYSLAFIQLQISAPSIKRILSDFQVILEQLPVVVQLPGAAVVDSRISRGRDKPPEDRILSDLSTVVLRI